MEKKKKQIVFIVCIVVAVLIAGTVFVIASRKEKLPTDYTESERDDLVEYKGKKYEYNEHLSNYLFLGIDTREPVETYETQEDAGQADAIMLVSYDRVKNTIACLSIPRDSITNIHMIAMDGTDLGTAKDHINIQYAFGDGKHKSCELMKNTVEEVLYGVPITGYCSLNMDGIPLLSSTIGEMQVTVPNSSLEEMNPLYKEGATITVTEENAELFVRYRNINITHSAMERSERQKVYIKAFAQKAKEMVKEDKDFIVDAYETLKPYMVTNISNDVFAKLSQADSDFNQEIQNIPGEKVDGIDFDEYHINETQLYELVLQMFYVEVEE